MVVIFDNDQTQYEDVIGILMQATGCDRQEAEIETWEAHTHGSAAVHFGPESDCLAVAAVIGTVGVKTEVRQEWSD